MGLTPEQLHEIGMALAQVEAAIQAEPEAFRYLDDRAHVVGDVICMALAQRGFVIVPDQVAAAVILSEIEYDAGIAEPKLLS
jgi:hypothetical protein